MNYPCSANDQLLDKAEMKDFQKETVILCEFILTSRISEIYLLVADNFQNVNYKTLNLFYKNTLIKIIYYFYMQ